ncbi:MAG: hypothetical protein Q9222_002540 [Ikaeria aurantiellina]
MTPAFGFSVGDFISTINLIRKISKALKSTGGASSEYQDAAIELKGLEHALQHLEALEPSEDNAGYVNAIRGMALACKIPLQEFMTKLERYEESLGPWAHRSSLGTIGRTTKWAVSFGREVEKLRAIVAAKQISINLLLATHCSQTISLMNHRTKHELNVSRARDDEHRVALKDIQNAVKDLDIKMSSTAVAAEGGLRTLSDKISESNTSVHSLRSIGEQILDFVKTFPQEIRARMQTIAQADWRTYEAVLQLQEHVAHAPTSLHDSNIQFTNVLGEHRSLPYEYFCHWEVFEGFLRAQFKDKPGELKVLGGSFHIIDSTRGAIVNKQQWNRSITNGSHLTMSMIMVHLRSHPGQCPQPDCTGTAVVSTKDPNQMECDKCFLMFCLDTSELETALERVAISENKIARQQIEEDVQLYGTRPAPSDAITMDEDTGLVRQSLHRDAPHFNDIIDHPAKSLALVNEEVLGTPSLPAMSPLEAWLNQSAIPSITPTNSHKEHEDESIVAQEIEEIKSFRSVHVTAAPNLNSTNDNPKLDEEFATLRPGSRIYYRNIKDRFNSIPTYLARRLAEANLDRAEALQEKKNRQELQWHDKAATETQFFPKPHVLEQSAAVSTRELSSNTSFNHEGFWNGGPPSRRPSSIASLHSRSSSMNSTLRGSSERDPHEEDSSVLMHPSDSPRGLPQPPVDLSKRKTFDCDICGERIQVRRRRQWQ